MVVDEGRGIRRAKRKKCKQAKKTTNLINNIDISKVRGSGAQQ